METLQYTAHQLQAAIAIVAVGVALVVWLVTRWCWSREVERLSEIAKFQDGELADKNEKIESLNATIAEQAADLQAVRQDFRRLLENIRYAKQRMIERFCGENCPEVAEDISDVDYMVVIAATIKDDLNTYKKKYAGEKSGHDRLKKAYDKVLAEVTEVQAQKQELERKEANLIVEASELHQDLEAAKTRNNQLADHNGELEVELGKEQDKVAKLEAILADKGISKTGKRPKLIAHITRHGAKFGISLYKGVGSGKYCQWISKGFMVTKTAAEGKIKSLENSEIVIEESENE